MQPRIDRESEKESEKEEMRERRTERKKVDNALLSQTTSTLIGDHSGLALGRGRTICYQIEVHKSDLRTQICCSHVQEFFVRLGCLGRVYSCEYL